MNRAHSLLTIKSFDESTGEFEGIASTPSTDRMGDIVESKGAQFTLPMPLLWQHMASEPIGLVTKAKVSADGITVSGKVMKDLLPRIAEAWTLIRAGLVRGLSIGFRPLEGGTEPINKKEPWGPQRFTAWDWLELSAVTIPANAEANIQLIKSIDQQQRATGDSQPRSVRLENTPADVGKASSTSKGNQVKTYTEQIKDLEATRAAKAAQRAEVMAKSMGEGRSTEESEGEEFDNLTRELGQIDKDLGRLRVLEAEMIAQAKAVDGKSTETANASRGAPTILKRSRDQDEKFKGQNYTRKIIARAAAFLDEDGRSPATIAQERWGKTNPTLVEIMKANEVPGGGTGSGEWGAELALSDTRYTGDFIEFLYGMTVYDRLPLRVVPANVHIKGQDGAATGYWVGESKPIPATVVDFSDVELRALKVGALAVISNELIRYSSPDAEMLVRDALVQASNQRVDTTFLSATAASAGVSPAGILNGLSAGTASGVDAAAIRNDITALYAGFISAKNSSGLYLVMTPALAKRMQLLVNALGQPEFPTMPGSLLGDPVITGDNVGAGDLILLKPSDIYRIGDMGVQVSISREAMIEQSSAPTGATDTPVAASQVFTSMFQAESTAIKIVRPINFAKRRTSAVAYIGDADYGSSDSP